MPTNAPQTAAPSDLYAHITVPQALEVCREALKLPGYWTEVALLNASGEVHDLDLFVEKTGKRSYFPARYSGEFRFRGHEGYFYGPTIRDCAENLADFVNNNCP